MTPRTQALREWLDGKPDDRFARYSLALELKKLGQTDSALDELRELLRRHPHSGAGHYQHGLVLLEAERADEARVAWLAGLDQLRGVDDPEARRSFGEIERALDDLE